MEIDKDKFDLLRAKKMLKINQISKLAGISKTSLNKIGKKDLSPLLVGKLAKALNVEVEELL